jgi:hypothetical protein
MCKDSLGSLWGEHLWQWRDVFALVSLDGVRPFFPDMAITLRDPQPFQGAVRATIQSYREAYVLTEYQPGSPDPKHPPTRAMIADGLANVARILDQSERSEMKNWLLSIYSAGPSMHPSANRYRWSLWDWVREYSFKKIDIVGFSAPDEIESRFRQAERTAEIEERIDEARRHPLSSWDKSVYELAGYVNDPHWIENETRDPYVVVQSTILMERFRRFWRWLLEQATTEQMLTLRRLAIEKTKNDEAKWGALPRLCDPDQLFP